MGSQANRLRKKWQDYSGKNAAVAEVNFYNVFSFAFEGTNYRIRRSPDEFNNIYVDVKLDKKVLSEIYNPEIPITKHGVFPDYAIDNTKTNKSIYVEVKRQDGWIEGGKRSDGRGNAHKRSCKFFTPGLLKMLRQRGNLGKNILPFCTVFQGDITRDPCRVREITLWYDSYSNHFFFWRDTNDPSKLLDHFENFILPLID
ncbi:MAG: MunI family type II restriction endonuclease [Ignavibacteria bacterium]|jgi:hypothetical protein|nr:MunI family type II restriction endonuclease [Ignavibacteria bacterium]